MGTINIDQLTPEMSLASDILTPDGRVILPSGSRLTEAAIRACKIWGVSEADIVGRVGSNDSESVSSEKTESDSIYKILAAKRFSLNDTRHPAVRVLARHFVANVRERFPVEQVEKAIALFEDPPQPTAPLPDRICLEEILEDELKLASLPSIFHEISEALKNPRSSAAYVADIISKDVSLSAKLLRMVNTPFYGFPKEIDTLSRAVTIVGTNQLTSLALGISVISVFHDIPEEHICLKEFWLHSITCGIIARLISTHLGLGNDERFFVAGLLHDIGRLMVLRNRPDMALATLERAHGARVPLFEVEKGIWGWDHADLGASMLKAWKLPAFLESIVGSHHAPGQPMRQQETAVAHVAEFAAHAVGSGGSGSPYVPPLDQDAWERLKLSGNDLNDIAGQATRLAAEVMAAFFHGE